MVKPQVEGKEEKGEKLVRKEAKQAGEELGSKRSKAQKKKDKLRKTIT